MMNNTQRAEANRHKAKDHHKVFLERIGSVYQIDHRGRIWRMKRKRRRGSYGNWVWVDVKPTRAECVESQGYLKLNTKIDGKQVDAKAHRIVWAYYYGDISLDLEINHKDGNKTNNCTQNLELVTTAENLKHSYAIGRVSRGVDSEKCHFAKLTHNEVTVLRALYFWGWQTRKQLTRLFDISRNQVDNIVNYKCWRPKNVARSK